MLVVIKAKNTEKFGNNIIGEYNRATNVINLWFNEARLDAKTPKLEIPEIDIPSDAKKVRIIDANAGIRMVCTLGDLNNILEDGVYKIPYKDWMNTKSAF